jgi:ankyrin repeat protein
LFRYIQEGFPVDFCDTPDHHGFTALHAACLSGQLEAAKILIANGAQINKTTSSGDCPFMLALVSGSPSLAHYLLEMGAKGDVVDKFGNSPMHIAMADGNRNIAMILIQKKFALHTQNRQGLTPLLCAVINGHRFNIFSSNPRSHSNQHFLPVLLSSFCAITTSVSSAPAPYAANFLCILPPSCPLPHASRW